LLLYLYASLSGSQYGLDKPDIFVYEQQLLTYASADRPEKCVELFETLQKVSFVSVSAGSLLCFLSLYLCLSLFLRV
jgi:hypothetical protein